MNIKAMIIIIALHICIYSNKHAKCKTKLIF